MDLPSSALPRLFILSIVVFFSAISTTKALVINTASEIPAILNGQANKENSNSEWIDGTQVTPYLRKKTNETLLAFGQSYLERISKFSMSALSVGCPPGNVLFVDALATGLNDGSSWDDAYTDLQDALADTCSSVTEIWVAAGIYFPTSGNSQSEFFEMKNNVGIYGGFIGTESALSQRDWFTNVTILSGDIGVSGDSTDNTNIIIRNEDNNLDLSAVIDGFTIIDALEGAMFNGNSSPTISNCIFFENTGGLGGGIRNYYSSPVVNNCVFQGNYAVIGGGIYNSYSSPIVSNCEFTGNIAEPAFSGQGGGMYNLNSSPTVSNCTFTGNISAIGGGMANISNTAAPALPIITDCFFSVNTATFTGGGMADINASPVLTDCTFDGNISGIRGAGIWHGDSILTVTGCTFTNNISSFDGGGMNLSDGDADVTMQNCLFSSNTAVENGGAINVGERTVIVLNSSFTGNTADTKSGGGIATEESTLTLKNCSFHDNSANERGGAVFNYFSSTIDVSNCILWGDTANIGNNEIETLFSNAPSVNYSIVEGGYSGTGNLDLDPLFVNYSPNDTLRLQSCSPAIDAGDNSLNSTTEDLDSNPRFVDANVNGTVTIDMGAYEYQDNIDNCACPDKSVSLVEPMDGEVDVLVDTDLTWSAPINEPMGYKLSVDTMSGGTGILDHLDVGNVTTYDLEDNLPICRMIYVTITPYYLEGDATGCLEESFFTACGGGGSPPDCTSLTLPTNGSIDVSVNTSLNWAPATSAPSGYKLKIGTSPGGGEILNDEDVGNVTTYQPMDPLPAGSNIYVRLTPYNAAGDAVDCTEESFLTQGGTPGCTPGQVLFVNENAAGNNDGSSWADAYTDLQDALADTCSNITEIWVAEGTYKPTTGMDRTAAFVMENDLAILGGFPGSGNPGLNDRDWMANPTVLTGDIGTVGDDSDNSYHVIFNDNNGLNTTAVLDGFVITKGNADGPNPNFAGGGLFNYGNTSPKIINCNFRENQAEFGGGIFNFSQSSPIIENCLFIGNSATKGGGLINEDNSSPILTNCMFLGNEAAEDGGAIRNSALSSPIITNCSLSGNKAGTEGGGLYSRASSMPMVRNCILWGNLAVSSGNEIKDELFAQTTVDHSIVEGGFMGTNNLVEDPLFINQPPVGLGVVGDLRLQECSPAIDTASNVANSTTLDLDGNLRVFDAKDDGTPTIDMGAYEYQTTIGNCNCIPNLTVNGNPIVAGTYASMGELTSFDSTIEMDTVVIFKSDTGVSITSDFVVEFGATFDALIEGCSGNFSEDEGQ